MTKRVAAGRFLLIYLLTYLLPYLLTYVLSAKLAPKLRGIVGVDFGLATPDPY